jgi:ketosteroid isomerase-like protein
MAFRLRIVGHTETGGGAFSLALGQVVTVGDDGRIAVVEQFDPDDREAMLARFHARVGEVAGSGARETCAPLQWLEEEVRRYNTHDFDALAKLYTEDFVLVDHRRVGWGTIVGRDALMANTAEATRGAPDITMEVAEVLACEGNVLATRVVYRGHTNRGGGSWELPVAPVTVYRDGLAFTCDLYDWDDREAILARFAELSAADQANPDR